MTFIQFIGNIYFSYTEIDETSRFFKQWVELTEPVMDSLGVDITNVISQKRVLALLEGGLLPLISLTCLHFFIQYDGKPKGIEELVEEIKDLKEELAEETEELQEEVEEANESLAELEETPEITEIEIAPKKPEDIVVKSVAKPIRRPGTLSAKMKRFGK